MATAVQVQLRRGSSSQVGTFTGAQGEVNVDTTNNRVVVQDGATAGGWPAAKLAEVITNTRTQVSDGNYTALTTDRTIAYITLTASRIVSLPAASTYPGGSRLLVVDESGNCSATDTITLSANGSDLIDGAANAVIATPYGYVALECNTANKWTIVDQVTTVNGLSGAVTIVANDGDVVRASGSTVTLGGPGGLVNKFRNGTMDIWQRGTSGTVTTPGGYTADGWIVLPTGASVTWAQAGGRLITKNSLQVTGATSATDVVVKQRIESYIAAAFCSQTVTVQAQVCNNTGAAITPLLSVKHAGAQDVWTSPVTDVSAVSLPACPTNTWTLVSYAFTASASSYNGLEIDFDFGNNFGSSGNSIKITECDIRVTPGAAVGLNANPPPPELRPIFTELPFCQRYYETTYPNGTAPGTADIAPPAISYADTADYDSSIMFPVQMRAAPTTVSIWDYGGNSGYGSYALGSTWTNEKFALTFETSSASGFVVEQTTATTIQIMFHYAASAEL